MTARRERLSRTGSGRYSKGWRGADYMNTLPNDHPGPTAKLRFALPDLVGKTIKGIVVSAGGSPLVQWHLVFTDGTKYEIYSQCGIQGGTCLRDGGIPDTVAIGERDGRTVTVFD